MAEVEGSREKHLGQVQIPVMILPLADPTSLLGVVLRFGRPTPNLSNKVDIALFSRVMAVGTAVPLLATVVSSGGKQVIRKPPGTAMTKIMHSIIKANTPSNNRLGLLRINGGIL